VSPHPCKSGLQEFENAPLSANGSSLSLGRLQVILVKLGRISLVSFPGTILVTPLLPFGSSMPFSSHPAMVYLRSHLGRLLAVDDMLSRRCSSSHAARCAVLDQQHYRRPLAFVHPRSSSLKPRFDPQAACRLSSDVGPHTVQVAPAPHSKHARGSRECYTRSRSVKSCSVTVDRDVYRRRSGRRGHQLYRFETRLLRHITLRTRIDFVTDSFKLGRAG